MTKEADAMTKFSRPKAAAKPPKNAAPAKDMAELFAPLRGLNIDFESDRSKDTGRDINLSGSRPGQI
jgi:hypothetical protein